MFKKFIACLILATSSAGVAYLIMPGGYDIFHGGIAHTFVGMFVIFGLLAVNIFFLGDAFFRKRISSSKKAENSKTESEELDNGSERRKSTYISMLNNLPNGREFKKDIDESKDQIARFESYLSKIRRLYSELNRKSKFDTKESEQALLGAITLFYRRIDSMITCIKLFDGDEYQAFRKGQLDLKSSQSISEKNRLFENSFQYVDEITVLNEEMILTIQAHLSDLTRFSLSKEWDNETILAMKRLNEYIKSMKEASEFESKVGESVMEYFNEDSRATMRMTRK